jgi:hypothetical protein
VYFKGPKSFTSEDVVELHLHSGRAVIAAALSALSTLPTLRSAEPGEFTRRAYLNGRLDLTQAEGLKDLIDAETEGQRKVAVRAAEGSVRQKFDELRKGVISALAKVEALIDFGEGEEIEEGVYEDGKLHPWHDSLSLLTKPLQPSRVYGKFSTPSKDTSTTTVVASFSVQALGWPSLVHLTQAKAACSTSWVCPILSRNATATDLTRSPKGGCHRDTYPRNHSRRHGTDAGHWGSSRDHCGHCRPPENGGCRGEDWSRTSEASVRAYLFRLT